MIHEIEKTSSLVWLSHPLAIDTPAYGGGPGLQTSFDKQLAAGHSCNSLKLAFSNHLGSHVDAPYHFVPGGKKINDYQPTDWIFNSPALIELNVDGPEIISIDLLRQAGLDEYKKMDILLIKTGFERYRHEEKYWASSPGFSPDLAPYFKEKFPNISAIGFDVISLTSYQHREIGREAHKAFLSKDIRILEDLSLSYLSKKNKIKQVIALPLRLENADGAPCTVIAVNHV